MFKRWCLTNFAIQDPSQATHLFMDNGKIKVPLEKFPTFLQNYYNAITAGETVCLIEKLGINCLMRFFLDIDYKDATNKDVIVEELVSIANKITDSVADVYICERNCGVHIIYNKLVDCNTAIEMANTIKETVSNDSSKYIDTSVYKTGLRMIGSYKYSHEKGYDKRCYMPLNDTITFEVLKRSIVRIKTNGNATTSQQNVNYKHIENYINKTFELCNFSICHIKKLGNYVSCTTNSKYCQNINKNHKNAKVYFVFDLSKRLCYQKCFCTCIKELPFTSCRNYKSKQHNVPYMLISHLHSFFS